MKTAAAYVIERLAYLAGNRKTAAARAERIAVHALFALCCAERAALVGKAVAGIVREVKGI
jgi:hypothetical protein